METICLLKRTKGAFTHTRWKIGGKDGINVINSLIERSSWQELQNGFKTKIFPIDFKLIIKTKTKKTNEADENLKDSAKNDTNSNPHNTTFEELQAEEINAVSEDRDADKDTDIIESRGERKEDETANSLLDGI